MSKGVTEKKLSPNLEANFNWQKNSQQQQQMHEQVAETRQRLLEQQKRVMMLQEQQEKLHQQQREQRHKLLQPQHEHQMKDLGHRCDHKATGQDGAALNTLAGLKLSARLDIFGAIGDVDSGSISEPDLSNASDP